MQTRLVAEMFNTGHQAVFPHALGDMFGPEPDGNGTTRRRGEDIRRQEIDARLAKPGGGIDADRVLVDLARRAELHQLAVMQHADMGRHGHRLDLIMRDIEQRRAGIGLDALQLDAKIGSQLGIE